MSLHADRSPGAILVEGTSALACALKERNYRLPTDCARADAWSLVVGCPAWDPALDWHEVVDSCEVVMAHAWDAIHEVVRTRGRRGSIIVEVPRPVDRDRALVRATVLGFVYSVSGDPDLQIAALSCADPGTAPLAAEVAQTLLDPQYAWASGRVFDVEKDSIHVDTIPRVCWQVFSPATRGERRNDIRRALGEMQRGGEHRADA